MASFERKLRCTTHLMAGLEERGFVYETNATQDENHISFLKGIGSDIFVRLQFSIRGKEGVGVSLMMASMGVTDAFHRLGLFLDTPAWPVNYADTVLSVDLLWLRWNFEANSALGNRADYQLGSDGNALQLLKDLDTVGQYFIDSVVTPELLAKCLLNIDRYPCHIKWGGKPVSANPYVYAAILFLQAGCREAARATLEAGLREYDTATPRSYFESVRLQKFQSRRVLLMRELDDLSPSK